jgi:hypothetical protein
MATLQRHNCSPICKSCLLWWYTSIPWYSLCLTKRLLNPFKKQSICEQKILSMMAFVAATLRLWTKERLANFGLAHLLMTSWIKTEGIFHPGSPILTSSYFSLSQNQLTKKLTWFFFFYRIITYKSDNNKHHFNTFELERGLWSWPIRHQKSWSQMAFEPTDFSTTKGLLH